MPQRYRCDQCATTSQLTLTDAGLNRERMLHRTLAHAGHIPDGERIIHVEPARLADLPREQRIASLVLLVLLAVLVISRLT